MRLLLVSVVCCAAHGLVSPRPREDEPKSALARLRGVATRDEVVSRRLQHSRGPDQDGNLRPFYPIEDILTIPSANDPNGGWGADPRVLPPLPCTYNTEHVIPASDTEPEKRYICDLDIINGKSYWRLAVCDDGDEKFPWLAQAWICELGKWIVVKCSKGNARRDDDGALYHCLETTEDTFWRKALCDPEGSTKTDPELQHEYVCVLGRWKIVDCAPVGLVKHVPPSPSEEGEEDRDPYANGEYWVCTEGLPYLDGSGFQNRWRQMECEPGTVGRDRENGQEYECTSPRGKWKELPCTVGATWYRDSDGQLFECVDPVHPWWKEIECRTEGARKTNEDGTEYICLGGTWMRGDCTPGDTRLAQSPAGRVYYEYVCVRRFDGMYWERKLCPEGTKKLGLQPPYTIGFICVNGAWILDPAYDPRPQPERPRIGRSGPDHRAPENFQETWAKAMIVGLDNLPHVPLGGREENP